MVSKNRKNRSRAKKIMSLASSLDDPLGVLDNISELRSLLSIDGLDLTVSEKLHIVKSMARAKVRALKFDNYEAFKEIDLVSNDLVDLL